MKRLWIFAALFSALCLFSVAHLAHAKDGDDVFMDEGEGDFDTTPMPTQAKKSVVGKLPAKVKRQPSSDDGDGGQVKPQVAHDDALPFEDTPNGPAAVPAQPEAEVKNHDLAPTHPTASEEAPAMHDETPAAHDAPPAVAEDAPAPVKKTSHAKTKYAGGTFVHTKQACPILREPAADSQPIAHTNADRKIWVEQVDEKWVKGFNKAGEPGYINRNCLD